MKLEFYRHVFEEYSNIIFHANPSIGGRAGGRTDTQIDTMELIVAIRSFTSAPENGYTKHFIYRVMSVAVLCSCLKEWLL